MSLFISIGEHSGDLYGKALLEALQKSGYDGPVVGMLGPATASLGAEEKWSFRELHIMGFTQVFQALPRLWKLLGEMASYIIRTAPSATVLIDSPDFHLPLARRLRRGGYKGTLFCLGVPTFWAWRRGRLNTLKDYYDQVFPFFPFEHEQLVRQGISSSFCGHPLLEEPLFHIPPRDIPQKVTKVALLPGSRRSEVEHLLPALKESHALLGAHGIEATVSVASNLGEEVQYRICEAFPEKDCSREPGRELMARSDAVIGACGTASMEALLLDRYMVPLYKLSPLNWAIVALFLKTGVLYVNQGAMPNFLLEEPVYPELLQSHVSGANAAALIRSYGTFPEMQCRVHERMARARRRLGVPGAYTLWASRVLEALS